MWTVARRQVRLMTADRGYFTFLALLPFMLGAMALVVPGSKGLGIADPHGSTPNEPAQILILLNISTVFMGTALTIRDLGIERAIFLREAASGLASSAYLCAKIGVFSLAAGLQTAVLTAIVVLGKGGPSRGAVIAGNPSVELYLTLALTAVIAAMSGLLLSAVARSVQQGMPMLVVAITASQVFSGGLIPVTGRLVMDPLSWIFPARWGFAATASTADLSAIAPFAPTDRLWSHTPSWWLIDIGMLVLFGVLLAGAVWLRLRSQVSNRHL
jgi:hypothetical protein